MPNVLSVENLSKKYGNTIAVDGISFELERNEIVGLLGPNGAGKTTTINMILGVLEPTADPPVPGEGDAQPATPVAVVGFYHQIPERRQCVRI